MTARTKLLFFLSLAVVLVIAGLGIQALLSEPSNGEAKPLAAIQRGPIAPLADAPQPADEAPAAPDPEESDAELSARVSAELVAPASVERDEDFDLAHARRIPVRVAFPSGTPADESVRVWIIALDGERSEHPMRWMLERDQIESLDIDQFLEVARASEDEDPDDPTHWARRELDSAHTCELPYPATASELLVLLEARYLYLPEVIQLESENAPAELTLEPILGARVHGRCVLPAEPGRRDVDPASVRGELQLFAMGQNDRAIGRGGMFHRRIELTPTGEFGAHALPAGVSLALSVHVQNLVCEDRLEAVLLEPGEAQELSVRFRLGCSIRGTVVDPDGDPVASAMVWSRSEDRRFMGGGNNPNAQTDADGKFALHGMENGEHIVAAQAEGWRGTEAPPMSLSGEQEVGGVKLVLERGLRISGKVIMPDGSPASHAQVSLYREEGDGGYQWRNTLTSKPTEEDGTFVISGLDEGTLTLEARLTLTPPELGEGEQTAPPPSYFGQQDGIAAGSEGLTIALAPTLGLSGVVLDDLGKPIESFRVNASPTQAGASWMGDDGQVGDSFSDEAGRFVLNGLHEGSWNVSASADHHHMKGENVSVSIPQPEGLLEIRLQRSASIRGIVQDPLGVPVEGARVGPSQGGSERPAFVQRMGNDEEGVVTGAEGGFLLEELVPGSFALEASAESWAVSEPVTVELPPGGTVEGIVVVLRNGGRIVGDAFDEAGEPLIGRQVSLGLNFMGMGMEGDSGLTTDAAGHFVFDHVDPGRYAVTVAPPQEEMLSLINGAQDESAFIDMMSKMLTQNVTVAEGQEVYVRLGAEPKRPVRVSGKVIDAGEPLASGQVFGITEGQSLFQGLKFSQITEGRYEFTLDRPGAYVFGVQLEQTGAPLEFQVDVPEAESFEKDLVLPLGSISGTVFGPDGEPAARVRVQATPEGGGFSFSMVDGDNGSTDADGRYTIRRLRPGTYLVRVGGGFRYGSDDDPPAVEIVHGVRVEEDRAVEGLDFHLDEAGRIEGTVVDGSGKPVGDVAVFARDERGLLLSNVSPATSEPNGRFVYRGIAPGRVTLSARGSTVAAGDGAAVDVREGEASEAEIVVEAATMIAVTVEDENGETIRATIQVFDERDHEVATMYSQSGVEMLMMEGLDSKKTRVGPLPPGKYEVRATAKDGRWNSKPVNLSGKEERNLRIKIRE